MAPDLKSKKTAKQKSKKVNDVVEFSSEVADDSLPKLKKGKKPKKTY